MRFEYQGRFLSVLIVVTVGRAGTMDPLAIYRPAAKQDFALRRTLWRRSVDAIKSEPPEPD